MQQISRIERRKLLTGWIKWAILPVIPFCILFFDAWLNIQVRYKDYELGQLNTMRRELNTELDMARSKEASLSGVEHLTKMAEQMQLASPTPQQFRTIAYREAPRRIPVMNLVQTNTHTTQPVVITLDAPSTAPPEEQGAEDDTPLLVAAPPNSNPAGNSYPENDEMPAYGDIAAAQPYTPGQDIYYEDMELSLLTVEDMLGRL